MAEALYRKYRPQVFGDVVGQDHIERTLKNAIEQGKVSHAYLFCGPRGTGKTTTARLLAKALLCESAPTPNPCGSCQDCQDIAEGLHPDVYELDAASRTGVENVREEIIGRVNFAPTRGARKIYIIDEVHMLSIPAFNALLKTLEEPPDHVLFILCTTDPHKVPETIQSRCQRFDFHRLSNEEIVARLGAVCVAENVTFEGEALDVIAHRSEGGMRNALTALEQLIAFGQGAVTVSGAEDLLGSLSSSDVATLVTAVGKRDAQACFSWVAKYMETGSDLAQFVRDMAEHIRNLYIMQLAGTDAVLTVTDAERNELAAELPLFGQDRLTYILGVLGDTTTELRSASNQRLTFEIALTRMLRPDSEVTLAALAARIEALEARLASAQTLSSLPSKEVQEAKKQPQPVEVPREETGIESHPIPVVPAPAQQAVPEEPLVEPRETAPAQSSAPTASSVDVSAVRAAAQAALAKARQRQAGDQSGPHVMSVVEKAKAKAREAQARAAQAAGQTPEGIIAPGAQRPVAQAVSMMQPAVEPGVPRTPASHASAVPQHATPPTAAPRNPRQDRASQTVGRHTASNASQVTPPRSALEPSRSAQPKPPQPVDISDLLSDTAAVQRTWRQILSQVKRDRVSYGALFSNVEVKASDQVLAVIFPEENPLAYKMAKKEEVKGAVEQASLKALGRLVPIAIYSQHDDIPLPSSGGAKQGSRVSSHIGADSHEVVDEPQGNGNTNNSDSASADAEQLSKMLSETMGAPIVFRELP